MNVVLEEKVLRNISHYKSGNLFKDEKPSLDILSLEELHEVKDILSYLCHNYDPFKPSKNNMICNKIITLLGLEQKTANPFTFSNDLLSLIDAINTKIKTKVH